MQERRIVRRVDISIGMRRQAIGTIIRVSRAQFRSGSRSVLKARDESKLSQRVVRESRQLIRHNMRASAGLCRLRHARHTIQVIENIRIQKLIRGRRARDQLGTQRQPITCRIVTGVEFHLRRESRDRLQFAHDQIELVQGISVRGRRVAGRRQSAGFIVAESQSADLGAGRTELAVCLQFGDVRVGVRACEGDRVDRAAFDDRDQIDGLQCFQSRIDRRSVRTECDGSRRLPIERQAERPAAQVSQSHRLHFVVCGTPLSHRGVGHKRSRRRRVESRKLDLSLFPCLLNLEFRLRPLYRAKLASVIANEFCKLGDDFRFGVQECTLQRV